MKLMKILPLFLFVFLLAACGDKQYLMFKNIEDAEREIGEIKTPVMSEGYIIKKITYENDGFTHPVTKIFYESGKNRIKFMIASSWFDDSPSEKVENDKIANMVWISKDKEYVLKWRSSDTQSYKYLFTKNERDKEFLINIAEAY